jgi:hypothetical protein
MKCKKGRTDYTKFLDAKESLQGEKNWVRGKLVKSVYTPLQKKAIDLIKKQEQSLK